jgi:hypothetical protein
MPATRRTARCPRRHSSWTVLNPPLSVELPHTRAPDVLGVIKRHVHTRRTTGIHRRLVVQPTATDSRGLSDTTSVVIDPETCRPELRQTVPSGASARPQHRDLDHALHQDGGHGIDQHTHGPRQPDERSDKPTPSLSWSDGGARSHDAVARHGMGFTATLHHSGEYLRIHGSRGHTLPFLATRGNVGFLRRFERERERGNAGRIGAVRAKRASWPATRRGRSSYERLDDGRSTERSWGSLPQPSRPKPGSGSARMPTGSTSFAMPGAGPAAHGWGAFQRFDRQALWGSYGRAGARSSS